MSDRELPPELSAADRRLREARFEPRASLEAEVLGRLRRGEAPTLPRAWRIHRGAVAAGLTALVAAGAFLANRTGSSVIIDRCCFDLDGGGVADDGVLIVARPGQRIQELRIYEDVDGSGRWTRGDRLKFVRGPAPVLTGTPTEGTVATECCLDWDGGGAADDGLMVVRSSPDHVVMAAVYETGHALVASDSGWQLR